MCWEMQGVTAVQLPVLHRVSSSSSSVPAARQSSAPTAPGARQPATAPAARDQPSPAAPWAPSAWLRELQEQTDPEWTPWNGSSPGAAGSWGPLAGTSSAKVPARICCTLCLPASVAKFARMRVQRTGRQPYLLRSAALHMRLCSQMSEVWTLLGWGHHFMPSLRSAKKQHHCRSMAC